MRRHAFKREHRMPSILIVEDEAALVELLRYNLEAAGFRVRCAMTGAAAEEALADELYDAVLLDWMLPEVSGIELCRRIRSRPETRNLPVIMLTAPRGSRDSAA